MEYRQLEYFTAITRLGGFRRAADELNISQPALSQQIKLLEQELGVVLFERGQRQITLTDAGRVLLVRAEHALAEVRMAREELREFATLDRGQVSVGVLSPSGMVWVPRLLAAFKQHYPRIDVTLVERSSERLLALLEEGRLHVAGLVWSPELEVPEGLAFERVFTGELAFALPPRHRLAEQGIASLAELADEPLILPPPGEAVRAIVDRAFASRGLVASAAVEVSDPAMRVELAAFGFGVAVASESYLVYSARERVAMIKPPAGELLHYSWVLASATRGVSTRASAAFLQFTKAQLRAWVRDGAVLTRDGWDIAALDVSQ